MIEPKHLNIIMHKMHSIIGIDWDNKLETFDYGSNLWTFEQEEEYKDWLKRYLKVNEEAREELMNIPSDLEMFIEKFVNEFVLSFGWKYKSTK